MKLLLINPRYPESFWSFRWAVNEVLPDKRAVNPPLGLATLAALTPAHWEVNIVDENVETVPLAPDADVVGVCGMGVQFARQCELLRYYRKAGYRTVAGGSFASLCPERYAEVADSVVAGEAEYIWKQYCADLERGRPEPLYRETGTVSLADSPVPRFDLLKLDRYTTATLQFSRGCPYLCEFCDIIVMFGRKPRHKSVEQVGRELDALRGAGARNAFFVDDNLIGHRAVARELLRFLADYQRRHGYPFSFGTEVSLNLAQDKELLDLFRQARFSWVFVGIESSDPETLKRTRKTQNTHEDVLTSVRRIYEHGIDVLAGFIVGFDTDTVATFEHQTRFIVESGVQAAMVGLLTALPKTPLYERLEKAGRLRAAVAGTDNTKPATNVVPERMSYEEMVGGYEAMYRQLTSDAAIAARIRNKFRYMRLPVYGGEYSTAERLRIVWRLMVRGVLPGGWPRTWHFLRSLPFGSPRSLPLAIVDWICGLSMRDYVDRHFPVAREEAGKALRLFDAFRRRVERHAQGVRLALSLKTVAPAVSVSLRGALPGAFFRGAARHLERLLGRTAATVTLRIEALREQELPHLDRLLARLARYGDRVSVVVSERMRGVVRIDSSVFRLVLLPEST
ncbi:MAG TPA: radical SAM protein [Burkholderiales bacterium]|nr:radical SAM protein [Burkholderiales bacterium]